MFEPLTAFAGTAWIAILGVSLTVQPEQANAWFLVLGPVVGSVYGVWRRQVKQAARMGILENEIDYLREENSLLKAENSEFKQLLMEKIK